MNRPFTLVIPDRLRIREGGGCMSLFGLPFFAAGIFLFLNLFGIVHISNANDGSTIVWPLLAFMAVAFTAVGGTLVFGRAWTIVDRESRVVIKQWGALTYPLHQRITPMHGITAVRLGFVEGDSDTADRFPITLTVPGGADLILWNPTAYEQARECARTVAELLRLEIEDASTDHPVRTSASQINIPLQERLRNGTAAPTADVPRPHSVRTTITRDRDGVTIEIPVRSLHWLISLAGIVPIGIAVMIGPALARFFRQSQTPDPVAWIFLGFITLFFAILPAVSIVNAFLRSRRGATIVEASKQGLRIRERRAWATATVASLDAADILDIDYSSGDLAHASAQRAAEQQVLQSYGSTPETSSPQIEPIVSGLTRLVKNRGLTVKSRTGLTTFGKGLEDEELRYLHSILRSALVE